MSQTVSLSYASSIPTFPIIFIGGDDYRDGRYPVTFDALTATATVTVTIFDDEVAECLEEFSLGLEIPEGSVAITESPDSATVSIRDDEGEWCSKTRLAQPVHSTSL